MGRGPGGVPSTEQWRPPGTFSDIRSRPAVAAWLWVSGGAFSGPLLSLLRPQVPPASSVKDASFWKRQEAPAASPSWF